MSDMDRIYGGLQEGLAAAKSAEWNARGCDARDLARSRIWSIEEGLAAYTRIQANLRDGRQHIEVPDDARDDSPRAANLTVADEGHHLCDTCEGEGVGMTMVCYGGNPVEKTVTCPDCDGEGQIEISAEKAAP